MSNDIPTHPSSNIPPSQPSKAPKEGAKSIISTILLFLLAPIVALTLTFFVIQSYEVDGPSMDDTLHNKDILIVNKLPRTWSRITGNSYVPKRGDIVIFSRTDSSNGNAEERKQLIKRVVGLPGERVVIKHGVITIYNEDNPNGFNPDEGQEYSANIRITPGNVDITVPEDEVFVVGDNRTNSYDSRNFGTIPVQNIVGELAIRVFPLNKARSF